MSHDITFLHLQDVSMQVVATQAMVISDNSTLLFRWVSYDTDNLFPDP